MASLFLFSSVLMAADEQKNYGMQKGDFSFSVGAGKNVYFDEEFEFVAPYMIPVSINLALMNKLEIGLRYAPVFFADRNNVTFENATSTAKNHKFGGVQAFGGDVKYAIYNDYGVMAFLSGGGTYNIMSKNEYDNGFLKEIDGVGYSITGGIGARYQLGDDDGDLFPWYFEMGLYCSRMKYDITNFEVDGLVQPNTESRWDDLNFNGLDIVISFGYRFRSEI
ncbi:MAG: hypothetical protein ACJA0Q_001805 [Saprospiraceae bacterium]|jgi:hypothetical protein